MKINKLPVEEIILLAKDHTQKEISKRFNVCQQTITTILKKNGVSCKRNRLNESKRKFNIEYFDEIDTPEKAYWLGFITADGCLKSNKIRIVSKDLEIIQKFKNSIQSEHKIVESKTIDKRSGKNYTSYTISITNQLFTKKVTKYINVDKSEHFNLPKLNKSMYKHFICGLFDGDGSLSMRDNKIRVSLISTKECLQEIQDILSEINISKTKISEHYGQYRIHLYKDALNFLKFVYDEKLSYIYLSRKYNKFINYENSKR
jgi:intein/homing endonuclease